MGSEMCIRDSFDDDDLYAPTYVERMVKALDSKKADLVKLSAFYYYDVLDDPDWLYRYDADDDQEAGRHLRRWSYGFSFVYRSELADSVGFHDDGWCGEDYDLATRAARLGYRCACVRDDADHACALHMRHRSNAIATPIFRSDGEYGVRMRGRVVQALQLRCTEDRVPSKLISRVFKCTVLDAMLDDDEE